MKVLLTLFGVLSLVFLGAYLILSSRWRRRKSQPEVYEHSSIPRAPVGWPALARAENGLTATMIQNMLESEGIEAIIEESHFSRLYFAGSEPSDMNTPVYVEPGKEEQAREILRGTDFAKNLV